MSSQAACDSARRSVSDRLRLRACPTVELAWVGQASHFQASSRGNEAGPVEVEAGGEDLPVEGVDLLGVAAGDVAVSGMLRITEPFLLSTSALSVQRRARTW